MDEKCWWNHSIDIKLKIKLVRAHGQKKNKNDRL